MPMYLTRFGYTPETWARLVMNPEDRRAAAGRYIESAGGKLHGFWYSFGGHDGYTLWEAPDNVSMAAVAIAQTTTGAITGSVTDPSGALIPNVKVTATNTATNIANSTQSNDAGVYNFPFLPIGEYTVTAEIHVTSR